MEILSSFISLPKDKLFLPKRVVTIYILPLEMGLKFLNVDYKNSSMESLHCLSLKIRYIDQIFRNKLGVCYAQGSTCKKAD